MSFFDALLIIRLDSHIVDSSILRESELSTRQQVTGVRFCMATPNIVRLVPVRPEVSKDILRSCFSIPQGERHIFEKPDIIVARPQVAHCVPGFRRALWTL